MTDRFKFRAWSKRIEKFIYNIQDVGVDFSIECWEDCFGDFLNNENYIIEQCTGLKDKNGTLIYEGDIVKSTVYTVNMKVVYCIEETFFGLKYPHNDDNRCSAAMPSSEEIEVIGNIHENADLLGEN